MTRSSLRPMAAVGLVAAVLIYVGCSKTYETVDQAKAGDPGKKPSVAVSKQPPAADPKAEKVPKFVAEWSARPPAGILLISGEQDGYPDPCGCTDGQLGGLGRRYDFLEKLQAKGWPVAKVDLGNLIHYQGNSRGGPKQEKIKFEIILQALAAMKYDAVALGPEDLKLPEGVLDTLGTLLNLPEPKFLAANVKPADEGLASTIGSTVITKAGPVTIGITAVLDPASFEALHAPDANLLAVKPPEEVLPAILEGLTRQAQVRVLMVQGPHEEAKRLAEKFPGFDLVVGTSLFPDPDEHAETVNGGKTLLVDNIGKKGKYVGVVGIFPGESPMLRFHRQALDGVNFHQAEPMRKLIDETYQERLKAENVVENFDRFVNNADFPKATYIGAEACRSCHPKTYEKWTTTKHARAFEALLSNPKRIRIHDAECISCHTTGFGYTSGWVSAEKTPLLKGNQCENCHGPASLHASDPDNLAYRSPMATTGEKAEKNNLCIKCHDEDNDHNFKFPERYAQIFHKGYDDYTDPKVHQGQPPKAKVAGQE